MITVKAVFVRNWGKNKLGVAVPKFPVSGWLCCLVHTSTLASKSIRQKVELVPTPCCGRNRNRLFLEFSFDASL